MVSVLTGVGGGFDAFLQTGPIDLPSFPMLADDLRALVQAPPGETYETRAAQAAFRELVDRVRGYFLTQEGDPRKGTVGKKADHASDAAFRAHKEGVVALAPAVHEAVLGFRRDLNVVLSRGVWRIYAIALDRYTRTLDAHGLLDFTGLLERTLELVGQMDEFARSRYKLESRYHHVLVDEFQDTSRAQWELVAQLVRSWGEGFGAASDALQPTIFVVGDRKQSIYGFRDADVTVIDQAAAFIRELRPDGQPRQAISVSFRSTPSLLGFVNDVFAAIVSRNASEAGDERADTFRYLEHDRFPMLAPVDPDERALGVVVGSNAAETAAAVADEIVRVLRSATVRDRSTRVRRQALPADVAILFRSRDSHRDFEVALEQRGVPTYVYKGLGFFDSDEIQDAVALLRYLAEPGSDLRAAAFLRSRLVRLSDPAMAAIGPRLAAALTSRDRPVVATTFGAEDVTVLDWARASVARWRPLVDRLTPAELVDRVLDDTAYAFELEGPRRAQARENLKKLRGLVRRIQNRGYATLQRIADHFEDLMLYDESNAAIDAVDAVSLMTVHAAKGLEFPVVFIVNVSRGASGPPHPIRVATSGAGDASVSVADYQSDADKEKNDRDREEAKRLLYVALTRARDRLYLSTTLKDGQCRPGGGGLGDVMPRSLVDVFERALPAMSSVPPVAAIEWVGPTGASHVFAVCPLSGAVPELMPSKADAPALLDDFGPLREPTRVRTSVRAFVAPADAAAGTVRTGQDEDEARLGGTLAHRLFGLGVGADDDELEQMGRRWLAEQDGAEGLEDGETAAIVARAVASVHALRSDARVASALASGRVRYEVPFSLAIDADTIVRGSIDCLVEHDDRRFTVIELKTGGASPSHDAQLQLYVAAVRALAPEAEVAGVLVYAGRQR